MVPVPLTHVTIVTQDAENAERGRGNGSTNDAPAPSSPVLQRKPSVILSPFNPKAAQGSAPTGPTPTGPTPTSPIKPGPTASKEAAKVFGGTSTLIDGDDDEEEDEEESKLWREHFLWRHRYALSGLVLLAVSVWLMVSAPSLQSDDKWKYTALAAGFLLGKPVAQGIVFAVVFVLQNILPLDQVAYYFHVLTPPLTQLFRFIGLAVMWSLFFTESDVGVKVHIIVVKVLIIIGLILASRCVSLLLVKMLTSSLHAGTFWDQLRSTVRHEVLLKNLTGPPIRPRPSKLKPGTRSSFISSTTEKYFGHAHTPSNQSDIERPAMQEMHASLGTKVSDADLTNWQKAEKSNVRLASSKAESLMRKEERNFFSSLGSVFKPSSQRANMTKFGDTERLLDRANSMSTITEGDPDKDLELKKATRLIFNHIRRPGNKFITKEAIEDFIPSKDVDEAFNLLAGVDKFEFSAIGVNDLSRGLIAMFEERKLLGQTLASMQGLAETLGRTLQVFFYFIIGLIALFMFNVDVGSLWLVFSSSVLALTFIFGASAARAFEAAVMIFAVHPFNIGDWIVYLDNNYKVMELGINCTKLLALGGEIVFVPTSQLATALLINLTRSNPCWMKISLMIDIGMTQAQAKAIEITVRQFMDSDKRNYGRDCLVLLRGDGAVPVQLLKVEFNVLYTLTFNGAQRGAMLEAHSRMLFLVTNALIAMGISYTGTDGMIFSSNMDTIGPSGVSTSTGAPPPTLLYARGQTLGSEMAQENAPTVVTASAPQTAIPEGFPPHTSFIRSNATQQRFALQGNLRHLSGMLKMD